VGRFLAPSSKYAPLWGVVILFALLFVFEAVILVALVVAVND
jgi:hypothetical protein